MELVVVRREAQLPAVRVPATARQTSQQAAAVAYATQAAHALLPARPRQIHETPRVFARRPPAHRPPVSAARKMVPLPPG